MTIPKTNAARLLDSMGLPYSLHSVTVDEDDLSALTLARDLQVPAEQVYKTLVARGDRHGVFMVCIMAADALDLKKAAKVTNNKSVALVPLKEVLPLTGYVRGGCSPLGTRKKYPVYVDESAILHEVLYVSAGQRGVQLCLKPEDLLLAVDAVYADLAKIL